MSMSGSSGFKSCFCQCKIQTQFKHLAMSMSHSSAIKDFQCQYQIQVQFQICLMSFIISMTGDAGHAAPESGF